MSGGPSEAERVRALREAMTATGAGIYLATHVAGPLLAEAVAAVHESDELELRIGRAGPDRDDDLELREREARAAVAAAIKAPYERVVLCHGSAEAARGLALEILAVREAGARNVVVVDGVPAAVLAAIAGVARAAGGEVDVVPAAPRILGGDVALVAMAQVDPMGRLADPGPVATAARRAGARLLVDASLSAGALPLEVADLGADALIADVHAWLLGPEGLAMAWLGPTLGSAPSRLSEATGRFGRGALLALARSVGWLLMYAELPWVVARTGRLAEQLYEGLAGIHGVEVVADRASHGALAAFRVEGWDADEAAEELSRSVFAIVDAPSEAHVIRVSVGAWNLEDELDRFLQRVAALASHTPSSLPRRPSLTVITSPDAGTSA